MKSYIVKIFAGASVSIIIAMNALNFLKLENIDSLEYMYIISYGGLFTFDIEHNIFGFFKILVPHILLIYLLLTICIMILKFARYMFLQGRISENTGL